MHFRVVDEAGEETDCVRASSDACDDSVRQAALGVEDLGPSFAADDGLQPAHDFGIGMGAGARADEVVGRLDVRDPIADRLRQRLLESPRPEFNRADFRPQELHPLHVRLLAAHVFRAHVHEAVETEARADGRRRDTVLPCSGLGHDARLAETPREERLAERVVDLVRAGVAEILALEVDALVVSEALGAVERRRPADVRPLERLELEPKAGVVPDLVPAVFELVESRHERLGDVPSAVRAEVAPLSDAHPCTASTKARTRAWSLTPGDDSRLRLASTHHGRTVLIAAWTFSGSRPPARRTRATSLPSRRRTPSRPRCPFSSG